ncbi:MAG TPA: hypothetical protein ENJ00_04325 [Phycisphaerales bacterium]|nr:hypothetical protein [Phycisphaerales bacterium]
MKRIVAHLFAILTVFSVTAQDTSVSKEIMLSADFGFQGITPVERFSPMRVWVQTADEPVSGTLVVQYDGMGGRSVRLTAPCAAAAGVMVPVPFVVKFPELINELSVTLYEEDGGRLASIEYASFPSLTQIQLPPMLSSGDELVVSLTPRAVLKGISTRWRQSGMGIIENKEVYWRTRAEKQAAPKEIRFSQRIDKAMELLGRARSATLPASDLPLSRMTYDGALVVIADGTTAQLADPRSIAALQRWVIGGGRLLILADSHSTLWRRLLPDASPVDALHLGPVQQVPIPEDLANVPIHDVRGTVQARPISMDLRAMDLGWSLRWGDDGSAMLAEGPVGFGWVTILSVHPDTISSGGAGANWTTWADALSGCVASASSGSSRVRNFGSPQSEPWSSRQSIQLVASNILDTISLVPPIGSSAFIIVGGVMVFLTLTLGPLDYFILRIFNLRHLSWLSAIVWIASASVVAYVLPERVRGLPSAVGRFTIVDQLAPNAALPGLERHPANRTIAAIPDGLRSWRTGLTTIFAGSSEPFRIEPDGSGAYWSRFRLTEGSRILRPLLLKERPNSGGLEAVHTAWPGPIQPGIWAVDTLVDRGSVRSGLDVSLKRIPGGRWEATLSGLPDSSRLIAAELQHQQTHIPLSNARLGTNRAVDGSGWRLVFDEDYAQAEPSPPWNPGSLNIRQMGRYYPRAVVDDESVSPALGVHLIGPIERTAAINALVSTGQYALLYLEYTDMPLDLTIPINDLVTKQTTVYRIVVPIVSQAVEASDD